MTLPTAPNKDLDVDARGNVESEAHEVRSKTTPNLRHETRVNDERNFEADFTVQYDSDAGELPADEKERNEIAVRTQAMQRGLVPTGPVKLTKTEKLGDGRNVRLVYQVPVELNTPDAKLVGEVAASEQPTDTPADIPERLDASRKAVDEDDPKPAESIGPVVSAPGQADD